MSNRRPVLVLRRRLGYCLVLTTAAVAANPAVAATAAKTAGSVPENEREPIAFCAYLSPDEESAPTYSPATGLGRFTLRRGDLALSWEIGFQGLTSPPIAANLHGPQRPGANAQVLFPLAAEGRIVSPLRGSIVLDDGQLEYLLTGRIYLNLTTEQYPDGELRAQLQRVRPGTACDATPPLTISAGRPSH